MGWDSQVEKKRQAGDNAFCTAGVQAPSQMS